MRILFCLPGSAPRRQIHFPCTLLCKLWCFQIQSNPWHYTEKQIGFWKTVKFLYMLKENKNRPSSASERKQKFFIIFRRTNIYRLTANVSVSRDYYTYVKKNMNRENETTEIEWVLANCGDRFIKLRPEKEKWVRAHLKTSVQLVSLFRGW